MALRSILLYFGNTRFLDYRARGKELFRWASKQDGGEVEVEKGGKKVKNQGFRGIPVCPVGRVALGQRQDGTALLCVYLCAMAPIFGLFCTEYNWREKDINFLPAIGISLRSKILTYERLLYALLSLSPS
jgi:hypothetical protein